MAEFKRSTLEHADEVQSKPDYPPMTYTIPNDSPPIRYLRALASQEEPLSFDPSSPPTVVMRVVGAFS